MYFEPGRLLFYRPLFMTELLVATTLFTFTLPRRKGVFWRIPVALLLCFGSCFVFPTISNSIFNISAFLLMYLVVFAASFLVFRSGWKTLIFTTIAGYNLQHASYEFYDLMLRLTHIGQGAGGFYEAQTGGSLFSTPQEALMYIFCYILLYWLAYVFFARRIKKGSPISIHSTAVFGLVVVAVMSDIVVNSVVLEFAQEASNATLVLVAFLSLMLSILCMTMQFEVSAKFKLNDDIATLKVVRSKEREQYRISKENAELLSMKAHDLKHQIHELGQRKSIADETIEEISSLVDIYDSEIKTGNASMDMILTEKSRLCSKNKIRLSIMADGSALEMVSEPDVYSLLGNILDNAIEATMKLEEDRRSIYLQVKKIKTFASIEEENSYDARFLSFDKNGLPITTKANKANHGYGVKSIAYVTEKYGGDLILKAEEGIFSLSILIPLVKSE